MITIYIFASVFAVSLLSLAGVLVLVAGQRNVQRLSFILVAVATGALLGDAFLHLIPQTFDGSTSPQLASLLLLSGIVIVMLFERVLLWHHDHHERDTLVVHDAAGEDVAAVEHARIEPLGRIVIFSDGLHNFLDGVAIAASFLVSVEVGVATTIAVALHEIPQEIGDFGILLHAGYSKKKALIVNFLSALTAVLGAVVVLAFGQWSADMHQLLIPIAAGSFIYIALADLIPELHRRRAGRTFIYELLAVFLGIGIMYALLFLE